METLTLNYKGIEINVTEINTDYVKVWTEEGEKTFPFPYDVTYMNDYDNGSEYDMFHAHPELLETIGEWAVNERAKMVAEIVRSLVFLSITFNKNNDRFNIGISFYNEIGCIDVSVFDGNKILKKWTCNYLGALAFRSDDEGYLHIGIIEKALGEYLKSL